MSLMPQRCEGRAEVREARPKHQRGWAALSCQGQAWEAHRGPEGAQGHLRAWEPHTEATGARLRGVEGSSRGEAGAPELGVGARVGAGTKEAVRFSVARFGSDPKEGMFSVRAARVPRILALHRGGPGGRHSSLEPFQQMSKYH